MELGTKIQITNGRDAKGVMCYRANQWDAISVAPCKDAPVGWQVVEFSQIREPGQVGRLPANMTVIVTNGVQDEDNFRIVN